MAYMNANQKKIAQDEKELEELEKQLKGNTEEQDEQSEVVQEGPTQSGEPETEPDNEEEKTFKKRYGDLRRYSQQKEKEFKDQIAELEQRMEELSTTQEAPEVPTTVRELDEWRKKNPSAARMMETLIQQEAEKLFHDAKMDLETMKSEKRQAEKEQGLTSIKKEHPDFDDLQEQDEFHDWVEAQPKWVQSALYENSDDPRSVIRVLDLYKTDIGVTKTKQRKEDREDQRAAASSVKTGGNKASVDTQDAGGKIKESWVNSLRMDEYEKHEEKIMDAMRSGNFIYDMSGGAR